MAARLKWVTLSIQSASAAQQLLKRLKLSTVVCCMPLPSLTFVQLESTHVTPKSL